MSRGKRQHLCHAAVQSSVLISPKIIFWRLIERYMYSGEYLLRKCVFKSDVSAVHVLGFRFLVAHLLLHIYYTYSTRTYKQEY